MAISILFVDDEKNVINGLKRMLFSMRKEWNLMFAESGASALETMAKNTIDVLVTDMRMPQMDGAELLEKVREDFPQTIRIILSGHSDDEMAIRSTRVAHQFIAKPCDAETLKAKIVKTIKLRELLSDKSLLEVVNGIDDLPSLPDTYIQLDAELKKKDVSIGKISEIISKDITMSAKILQIVNSAFFGLPSKVTNTGQAVNLLGVTIVKSLILYVSTFGNPKIPDKSKFYLETLWDHSFLVGNICRKISRIANFGKEVCDDAYTAGILHDIGKLILLKNSNYYNDVFALMGEKDISILEAEKTLYKTNHSEIGGYLLGIWGLPENIVEAVAFHYSPEGKADTDILTLPILYLANKLSVLKVSGDLESTNLSMEETGINLEFVSEYFSDDILNSIIKAVKDE
ncbi:MAG: HDOD domain-containing protein [Rhodothermaceae bacterium]